MSIIEVKNLSKKYDIGERQGYIALRDVLANIAKSPVRWFGGKVKAMAGQSTHNDFWALSDVNFTVEKGEVMGIIGRNGAGKSTLLKIFSQITPPTTGEIKLRGRVGSLLEVGTGFHPELTGRENIFLNGSILGMRKKEIEKKFDEIVEFAGIDRFLDTPVKRYSSGMFVRLAFAVAAHLDPEILIVDEVLAVGDAEFQKKCLGKMEDITKKEGRTVLFVSHNMGAIQNLCQRTILLEKGCISIEGSTEKVVNHYLRNNKNLQGQIKIDDTELEKKSRNKAFFTEFKVTDSVNKVMARFTMGQEIYVFIKLTVKETLKNINPGIRLFNQLGQCIFSSTNIHTDDYYQIFKPGDYTYKCIIPANFFNEGTYYLSFSLTEKYIYFIDNIEQVVSFEIIDDYVQRGEYSGGWIGVVRPKLNWYLIK